MSGGWGGGGNDASNAESKLGPQTLGASTGLRTGDSAATTGAAPEVNCAVAMRADWANPSRVPLFELVATLSAPLPFFVVDGNPNKSRGLIIYAGAGGNWVRCG